SRPAHHTSAGGAPAANYLYSSAQRSTGRCRRVEHFARDLAGNRTSLRLRKFQEEHPEFQTMRAGGNQHDDAESVTEAGATGSFIIRHLTFFIYHLKTSPAPFAFGMGMVHYAHGGQVASRVGLIHHASDRT